jgi:predicted  nucleic acid-binding Zn-ribbon protein
MWMSDNINVGMLTSSNASAISSSDVVNGCPACGLRTFELLSR